MSAYVLMVSHGGFAEGLCDTLHMFAGNSEGIMSIGLRDGESVERFRLRAQTLIAQLDQQDELLVLADLIGGSPLTTVLDVLQGNAQYQVGRNEPADGAERRPVQGSGHSGDEADDPAGSNSVNH
ncbi:MAG: PTS sugar transporter subunit IIA [Merdibacter sp.]